MTFETIHDPDAVEDFSIDWSDTLEESSPIDTITASSWTAEAGLTIDSDTNTTSITTVWVSGGTLNSYQKIINEVETAGGRTYNRTITLKVQEK